MKIPFNRYNQFYLEHREEILNLLDKTLTSGKYIRENNVLELERNIAEKCDRAYSITTSSCTDALYFALKACGIKDDDEVIIPSYSYIASLEPILRCRAVPVFADITPDSLMLDLSGLQDLVTSKTKAIILVQLFGSCLNDFAKLKKFAEDNELTIIEDAAQALGSSSNNIKGGKFGDISCISFDPTKIISAFGTGGAILTDNIKYYKVVKQLVHHGQNDNIENTILGYNSKISALNATIINLQLNSLETLIAKTNEIANNYINRLKEIKEIKIILPYQNNKSTFHKFVIIAENRNALKKHLDEQGIETKIHYSTLLPDHKLLNDFKYVCKDMPIANTIKNKVLSLPIYYSLSKKEIDYICDYIIRFYKI